MTPGREPARNRLMRAGEILFARDGIDGARIGDLNALAEVRNDSSIHYHFGSRAGLIDAILVTHSRLVGERITANLAAIDLCGDAESDLRALIQATSSALARELTSESGRNYIRILSQVFAKGSPTPPAEYAEARANADIQRCLAHLPTPIRKERLHRLANFMVASMASRARKLDQSAGDPLDHDLFVANLVEMAVAACLAPVPPKPGRRASTKAVRAENP